MPLEVGGAEEGGLSAGKFPDMQPLDRSPTGLQYQRYQIGLQATGAALGVGRRVVPEPQSLFSSPPNVMSGSQNGGGHAKSIANVGPSEQEFE